MSDNRELNSQIIFPSVLGYSSVPEYFTHFKKINIHPGLGYRQLVSIIKWPVGYLDDVAKNRRQLTIERAIQFGTQAEFNNFEINRLIFMALSEVNKKQTSSYFRRVLEQENSYIKKYTQIENHIQPKSFKIERKIYKIDTAASMEVFQKLESVKSWLDYKDGSGDHFFQIQINSNLID